MEKLPPRVRSAATTKKRTRSQFKRQNELRSEDFNQSKKSGQDSSRPLLSSKRRKLVKEENSSKLLQARNSLNLKQKASRIGQN